MSDRPSKRQLSRAKNAVLPALENIRWLLEGHGDITLGRIGPVACAATAADEDRCLAMLVRREGESLEQLLVRLDAAIDLALEGDEFIDEINA